MSTKHVSLSAINFYQKHYWTRERCLFGQKIVYISSKACQVLSAQRHAKCWYSMHLSQSGFKGVFKNICYKPELGQFVVTS